MNKLAFGELELSILKVIRELKLATVRDVYKALGCQRSYTTIMTVMSRMADKGELKRKKEGKQYIYWIPQSGKISPNQLIKRFMDKIFGGKPLAMMAYLLEEESELNEQDLKEIEKMIEKRRKEKNLG